MIPQWYKCPKCKSSFQWSENHDNVGFREPLCPVCYYNFIKDNVPTGIRIKDERNNM